jgi:hypothetical protein
LVAGQFQKPIVGDAPNPKIIPVAGMAARLFQTFFSDGDKVTVGILAFRRNA